MCCDGEDVSADEIQLMQELLREAGRALPHLRLFRRNVLRLKVSDEKTGKTRMVVAGIKGQGDLYFYTYGGGCGEIEIKSQNGQLSKHQRAWRDWCQAGRIPWLCLWPWPGETREQTVQRWVEAIRLVAGQANGTLSPQVDEVSIQSPRVTRRSRRSR